MTRGNNIAEECHVVNILPPVDIAGGVNGDVFCMKNYTHATIIIQAGVSAAAWTKILLNECTDFSASNATAIAFNVYKEETAEGDTLGARTAVTAAGLTPSANNSIFYVIELDAAELSEGYEYVQLSMTNGVNSVIASAVAILSGARYSGDANGLTAIA